MTPKSRSQLNTLICIFHSLTLLMVVVSMDLFNVKFIEQNDSRLIATSNYNYAITSPKLLTKNWKTVSVNGDSIFIVTPTGDKSTMSRTELSVADRSFIEGIRDEIANGYAAGYTHMSSMGGSVSGGGGSMMMSSSVGGGSSTSFSSSTSGVGIGQGGTLQMNDLTLNMKDDNNFSVAKSDLPFNWSRVFYNGEIVTVVYKSGEVRMAPIKSMELDQLDALNKLKVEVETMRKTQSKQFSDTMRQSVDMVSNVFDNVMNQFPRPPDYETSVGGIFGNNFPFGPNNSPFSAAAGWPFG